MPKAKNRFTFLDGWGEKEKLYMVYHENYRKFKFWCPETFISTQPCSYAYVLCVAAFAL